MYDHIFGKAFCMPTHNPAFGGGVDLMMDHEHDTTSCWYTDGVFIGDVGYYGLQPDEKH